MTKFVLLLTVLTLSTSVASINIVPPPTSVTKDTTTSAASCANGADAVGRCFAVGQEAAGHHSLLALRSKVKRHDDFTTSASSAEKQLRKNKKRAALIGLKGQDRAFHQLQAGSVAAAHYKAKVAVTAKARKAWVQSEKVMVSHVQHTEEELEQFIHSIHESSSTCSAKVLKLFATLQDLTGHVKSMSEEQLAHQAVLTSATADLQATDEALADSHQVYDSKILQCGKDRAEAAAKYVTYTNELEELAQIGNPEVRAEMASHHVHAKLEEAIGLANASYGAGGPGEAGDIAAAAAEDADDDAPAASLLETGKALKVKKLRKKAARGAAAKSWSKKQCLAFLKFKATSGGHGKHRRQPANATEEAGNGTDAEEEEAGLTEDTCETDQASLETKFQEAYSELNEMKTLTMAQKDSTECDSLSKSELDAELVPLTTQREHATDKIEESEAATDAMQPVISMLKDQVEHLKEHVTTTKQECTDAQGLETHLNSVATLIASTNECPGVSELHLPTPHDICHTNGLTCSWSCSDKGSIFQSGLSYGGYEVITNCPTANEVEGRAFCEMHCIKDVHCVGFTLNADAGECLLKLDVLGGEFSPAPELAQEITLYSCFIKERQALVDRFRDPIKPTLDHSNLNDHWTHFNECHDETFDTHGLDHECYETCSAGGTEDAHHLPQELQVEATFEETAHHTLIDACGCGPTTGWCAEDGMCEAGQTTDAGEAACCAQGKKMLHDTSDGAVTHEHICVDSCGCPAGSGWCTEHGECEEGKETSAEEEACCFVGMTPQSDGGNVVCFDACGCSPGSGWSRWHEQCEASEQTDTIEAACCAYREGEYKLGGVPGRTAPAPDGHGTCTPVVADDTTDAETTTLAANATAVF